MTRAEPEFEPAPGASEHYDKAYYDANGQSGDRPALRWYMRMVRRYLGAGPYLDFGCGTGFLLRRLSEHGSASGFEISEYSAMHSRHTAPGSPVYTVMDEIPSGVFRGLTAIHVLEHLDDETASAVLGCWRRVLLRGGRALVVMPDPAGRARALAGENWTGYQDPTHINLKPHAQWRSFLTEHGFSVLREGSDGLWNVPYSRLPKLLDAGRYAIPSLTQYLAGRLFLRPGTGESSVFVVERAGWTRGPTIGAAGPALDTSEPDPPSGQQPAPRRRSAGSPWNRFVIGVTLVGFAALIWNRRWISDDGLIVLRTVRQLLAGQGPVFNVGERVEANTSTLWTAVLALPGLVPGVPLNWAAIVLGLLLSVAGLGLAMDATRRLVGRDRRMLPLGALVVVALPPFWDFGTSGLETGLIIGWLGLTWWLLVGRLEARRAALDGPAWPAAVAIGLAPLVRPDLALFGMAAGAVLVLLEWRHGRRRLLGLAAAAAALPLAYEVFRAGYYGLLVPSTALAKEAADPRWGQGLGYVRDLVDTYALGIPLAALVLAAALGAIVALRRPAGPARLAAVAVAVAPVLAGVLMAAYVVRVGGDFMHGRMLLPALFAVALPVMVVPLAWHNLLPVLVTGVWSLVAVLGLRPAYEMLAPNGIANERLYYVSLLGVAHPVVVEDFRSHPVAPEGVAALAAAATPSLALAVPGDGDLDWLLFPESPGTPRTIVWLNLGVTGELAPLDVRVLDGVGLTNPLAAHATGVPGGRIGHDKDLPPAWYLADTGVVDPEGFGSAAELAAARAAIACPRTVEMLDSVRAPLTVDRFWRNLTGAWERTAYRYSRAPAEAATCAPA